MTSAAWRPARVCGVPWPALLGALACLVALCALFPYSADDWYWGSSLAQSLLERGFSDYNGRYFSNLLCMALTRLPWLHVLVVAATLAGIALCMQALVGREDTLVFWLALLLLFFTPVTVWAQGLVWTSGFVNYTLAALIVLLYILAVRPSFEDGYRPRVRLAAPLALLGFLGSLVVEILTVANLVASLVVLFYTWRRHKCLDPVQLAFFLGAAAGAVLMFSNGAYLSIAQGSDTVQVDGNPYRQVAPGGLLHSALSCAAESLVPCLVLKAWPLQLLFAVFALFHARAYAARPLRSDGSGSSSAVGSVVASTFTPRPRRAVYMACIAVVLFAVAVYGLCFSFALDAGSSRVVKCANVAAGLAWAFVLLSWCLLLWRDGRRRELLVLLYAAALALPLLAVSRYGPRCYLPSYLLLCALACLLVDICLPAPHRLLTGIALAGAALLFACWAAVYVPVHAVVVEREALVAQAEETGATELVLPSLGAGDAVWRGDPSSDMLARWYRYYYGLDKGVRISVEG